ncbi:MAG TPA: hypothetical protein VHX42_02585 [Candidatus Babeliales bacterium]|nr:hypothetical protein [Candidatus Babeliales bacterium]
MKSIKNIITMLTIACVASSLAKVMKKTTTVQSTPVVIEKPAVPQPIIQPLIPSRSVQPIQPSFAKASEGRPAQRVEALYHLVPTDANTLRQYDLCPLFGEGGGFYPLFNPAARTFSGKIESRFDYEYVSQNAPCMVRLVAFENWNRLLLQLKSLDQGELAEATGLSAALCAGHSLNNGRLMRDYALTGNTEDLRNLHNIQESANFLLDHNFGEWLNVEDVKKSIEQLRNVLGIDGVDVSAISTVSLFDSNLDKKPGFAIFNPEEFAYVQQVKRNIRAGLQQDNYIHVMIIGNEETVEEALGHYFCFVIIKAGNDIQYIVLDTSAVTYHLQPGSHAIDRLMFVIQNVEQGYSSINVTNIRVQRLHMLEEERISSLKK